MVQRGRRCAQGVCLSQRQQHRLRSHATTRTCTHLHALLRTQCQPLQDAVDAQRTRQQQRRRKRQRPLCQKHLQCTQTREVTDLSSYLFHVLLLDVAPKYNQHTRQQMARRYKSPHNLNSQSRSNCRDLRRLCRIYRSLQFLARARPCLLAGTPSTTQLPHQLPSPRGG